MGYTSALETCSQEVRRGVEWLKDNVDVDNAGAGDAEVFYVLEKFDQELVERYLERAKSESFWGRGMVESPGYCWFLAKLGLSDNPYYRDGLSQLKDSQSRDGMIWDSATHAEVLRTLVLLEPDTDYTEKAVHYIIDNPEDWETGNIAVGVLALTELDYERYQREINTKINILFSYKSEDGGFVQFRTLKTSHIFSTSLAIQAISRIGDYRDSCVQEATNWLKQQQNNNGSWGHPGMTAIALLALIAAGDGPKIPLAEVEWKEALLNQKIERTKPHFIHTSPIFDQRMHVKDIYVKIGEMLNSAETEIKILSLYIDMMYDDIINLAENNPDLSIKIITRPSKDNNKGMRVKIGKNALDLLKIATRGDLKTNEILHARMIIADDKEALISSADLTRDQLMDEFNSGIWVRDKETVKRATEFFDNIWEESKKKE